MRDPFAGGNAVMLEFCDCAEMWKIELNFHTVVQRHGLDIIWKQCRRCRGADAYVSCGLLIIITSSSSIPSR